jgi:isopenicillin-N N-acyltransferase-like protein
MSEKQMKLLKLKGSSYEIGFVHGREAKEEIRNFIAVILEHGKQLMPGLTKEKALSQARLYVPFIEACAPHLAEEIEGISVGAGISLDEAYLLQLRAEFTQVSPEGGEDCTSFAVPKSMTEDGNVLVGQNLDLNPFYKDFGTVLHITPEEGPAILCYSQLGSLAHMGINSAGLGWVTNALFSSGWRPGVPRSVLYRLILEQESVSEAVSVITNAERASSCNYLISHRTGEIRNIETTAGYYGMINMPDSVMVHTNHYLHPNLSKFEGMPKDKLENSQCRQNRFKELIIRHKGKLSLQDMEQFLNDHENYPATICRHTEGNPWNVITIASMVAQPADGLMHVSFGQGCQNKYITYSL